ncbi:latrophilin Cirl-like [Strongylocentrotus purpuratus]|uniref:GAIN-B domain-containing protein n=1 Tax=Strongylocentrotus purpuratus TaxID=7668 RepID=A0A7M7PGV2_STRPU|nr:latrophilin Cirl-like [Strongylocentrotus purpuratus]
MKLQWMVTESITSIASNLAQVKTEELEAAEEESGAIGKFIQAFEEQISRVEVADGGMLNIQQPNVAVQVQSVLADDLMRGLVLSLAGSSLSDLTKSNITINAPTQADRDDVIATRPDIIAQVNIPPSILSVISSTTLLSNGSGEYVRVIFNVFSTPALFISKSLRTISGDSEVFNRSANSPVISLSIGQGKVAALTEFINFTFTTIKSGYVNSVCSFWDEEVEDWSQDGCVLVSGFASSDERYDKDGVRCACNHLTNFAVIMGFEDQTA